MRVAIVGCGYVADYYLTTLRNHPSLELLGVYDRDEARAAAFSRFHGTPAYDSLAALLADPRVEMVLNLTNPASHFEVSRAALLAGKHVYSEKPLALRLEDAEALVALAAEKGLSLAAAPCSILGEAARATARAIEEGRVGKVRLVYAEMEDSMVFRENFRAWRSRSGAPWPAEDEFAVGCTLEHAGYYLTWLCAFFGPVAEVTAFAARCFDDKNTGQAAAEIANDFSVSCLKFRSGVVARLTCGLVAPRDRSMHIVGDKGVISVSDGWNYASPVYLRHPDGLPVSRIPKLDRVSARLERYLPLRHWLGRRLPATPSKAVVPPYPSRMDFSRGPAAIAEALSKGTPLPMTADFALHITELALVAQYAERYPMPYRLRSTFSPLPRLSA